MLVSEAEAVMMIGLSTQQGRCYRRRLDVTPLRVFLTVFDSRAMRARFEVFERVCLSVTQELV